MPTRKCQNYPQYPPSFSSPRCLSDNTYFLFERKKIYLFTCWLHHVTFAVAKNPFLLQTVPSGRAQSCANLCRPKTTRCRYAILYIVGLAQALTRRKRFLTFLDFAESLEAPRFSRNAARSSYKQLLHAYTIFCHLLRRKLTGTVAIP